MKRVFRKAAMVAVVSAVASPAFVSILLPMIGGRFDRNALVMSVSCGFVIAFLGSVHAFRQKKLVRDSHAELTRVYERLADAHAQLAEAHARLSEKARHDEMTGLLNRESFFFSLKNARRRTDAGTLLIIDADNFKHINDTHGHAQGDVALTLIAAAIRAGTRDGDVVGRIGGEEFAAFLCGATEDEAALIAEHVRLGVEAIRFSPGEGKLLPLSVSIGAARLRAHLSWSELMREADRHLYEAKRRGRNRVVFALEAKAA